MTTYFVSDLHLDGAHPEIADQFLAFLEGDARGAEALYILGDLFEVWVGDDDPDPHKRQVGDALRALTGSGVPGFFIHGNRDFLIGEDFAAYCGITLLAEPTVTRIAGRRVLLSHGDALCTDDLDYQAFRTMVRDSAWQAQFLAMPLDARQAMAAQARAASKTSMSGKSASIMDVNQTAVETLMREHEVSVLVHGHTHRPAVHRFTLDGDDARRIVLGDWYTQGSVLDWDADGYTLEVRARD